MPEKQTKQQRLEQARADAKAAREARERRARRLRWLVPALSAVAILLVVVVVIAVVALQPKPSTAVAGPPNMASDGVAFEGVDGQLSVVKTAALKAGEKPAATVWPAGDTRKHVVVVTDLGCPFCKLFEQDQGQALLSLVKAGKITLEIHPINFISRNVTDGSAYSARAANALAMVAAIDPAHFFEAYSGLYANQPEEGTSGLTNDDITAVLHTAGVNSQAIDDGIRGGTYLSWVQAASTRALDNSAYWPAGQSNFPGTPSVFVNGTYFNFTKTDYSDLIAALS